MLWPLSISSIDNIFLILIKLEELDSFGFVEPSGVQALKNPNPLKDV